MRRGRIVTRYVQEIAKALGTGTRFSASRGARSRAGRQELQQTLRSQADRINTRISATRVSKMARPDNVNAAYTRFRWERVFAVLFAVSRPCIPRCRHTEPVAIDENARRRLKTLDPLFLVGTERIGWSVQMSCRIGQKMLSGRLLDCREERSAKTVLSVSFFEFVEE